MQLGSARWTWVVAAIGLALAIGIPIVAGQGPPPSPPRPPAPPPQVAPAPPGPPASQQELTRPPEGTGAISGVVVDGATGQPMHGALVTLSVTGIIVPGAAPGPDAAPPIVSASVGAGGLVTVTQPTTPAAPPLSLTLRQFSDEKGRFIFQKLPAALSCMLRVSKLGYFESDPTATIALDDGQWVADRRLTLWKYGAISGTVLDEAGEPVVGAFVRALAHVFVAGTAQVAAGPHAKTDDRGVYRIPGLSPGKYLVNVPSVQWSVPADTTELVLNGFTEENVRAMEAAGRPPAPREDQTLNLDGQNLLFIGAYPTPPPGGVARQMVYPITFYPSARSTRDATVIELRRGESRSGVDLTIRPVAAVRVSGRVTGPTEAQGPGMTLRLLPAGAEGLANGSEAATALAAKDGSFTFLNVPAGDYTIVASRTQMEYRVLPVGLESGGGPPSPPGVRAFGSGSGAVDSSPGTQYYHQSEQGSQAYAGRVRVTVGDSDVTGVVVSLIRAVRMTGTVVMETVRAPDPAATPFRWPIYADPADGTATLVLRPADVQASGPAPLTFTIDGLQPGPYVLRVLGGTIKSITWNGRDYTSTPFDASAGQDFTGVVITTTDQPARMTGSVRDARGQPATSGGIIVFPAEREQWTGYGFQPRRIRRAGVATNGTFRVTNVPAGRYLAIAVDDPLRNAWRDPAFLAAAAALATSVTVEWGETKTVDLAIRDVPGFRTSTALIASGDGRRR